MLLNLWLSAWLLSNCSFLPNLVSCCHFFTPSEWSFSTANSVCLLHSSVGISGHWRHSFIIKLFPSWFQGKSNCSCVLDGTSSLVFLSSRIPFRWRKGHSRSVARYILMLNRNLICNLRNMRNKEPNERIKYIAVLMLIKKSWLIIKETLTILSVGFYCGWWHLYELRSSPECLQLDMSEEYMHIIHLKMGKYARGQQSAPVALTRNRKNLYLLLVKSCTYNNMVTCTYVCKYFICMQYFVNAAWLSFVIMLIQLKKVPPAQLAPPLYPHKW